MYEEKIQGSTARRGRISMTLYGRTVHLVHRFASTSTAIVVTVRLFARSSAPHGEYKRSKYLVRTIRVVYYNWFRVGNAPKCAEQALSASTRRSSKQGSAPRRPVWCSKVAFNGPTCRKNDTRLVHVSFLFVRLVEWPVSILAVYDRSRVFFNALSHEKGHIFLSLGLVVAPIRLEYWGNLH